MIYKNVYYLEKDIADYEEIDIFTCDNCKIWIHVACDHLKYCPVCSKRVFRSGCIVKKENDCKNCEVDPEWCKNFYDGQQPCWDVKEFWDKEKKNGFQTDFSMHDGCEEAEVEDEI